MYTNYNCMDTCKMVKPCKNKHCSANPKYIPVPLKRKYRKNDKSKATTNTESVSE